MTNPPFVPYHSLLAELHALLASGSLAELYADASVWTGLSIDYHPPRVERLQATLPNGHRIALHRLHPCEPDRALWHSHPWPAAVQILAGTYEHCTGFVDRHGLHCNARSIIGAGVSYEIVDPLAWHSVRPISEPVYSVMLTGKPWPDAKHSAPKPAPQRPLTTNEVDELRMFFDELLGFGRAPAPASEPDRSVFVTDTPMPEEP